MKNKNDEIIFDNEDLERILELIKKSEFEELELIDKESKFVIRKRFYQDSSPSASFTPDSSSRTRENPPHESSHTSHSKPSEVPEQQAVDKVPIREMSDAGQLYIKSPMMGIFYRAPSPGAPPFVEIGDEITEQTTVCIIEVMKVMSSIKAGIRGRIKEILVENAELVEYEQPLFLVEPEN